MIRTIHIQAPLLLALLLYTSAIEAASMSIAPGQLQSQVAAAIAQLGPGDTLTVTPGSYTGISLDMANSVGGSVGIAGTAANPITITGQISGNVRPLLQANTAGFHLQHITGGSQTTQAV